MPKQKIKQAESRDALRFFSWSATRAKNKTPVAELTADYSLFNVMEMVDSDPVARGAINHFVDKCVEGGYIVLNKDSKKVDEKVFEEIEEKYMFRTSILRKIFLIGKLFNNVFLEIVKDSDNNAKELNILDSTNIKPITKINGDPLSYESRIENPATGAPARWTKEEIVWFKFGDRAQGFAPVDVKALHANILAKQYLQRYISWLWKTGQYRVMFNFKDASEASIEDFIVYNKQVEHDYTSPFLGKGEVEVKVLRDVKETDSIINLLKYYDSQTLILLRVPPIDAGIPDSSGRANADSQNLSLAVHVKSWKQVVEDTITFDLFKKINKENSLFKFKAIDRFVEQNVFENLQIMKNIGMSEEAIAEYLQQRRIFFKTEKIFTPIEELGGMGVGKDPDLMPSRFGPGKPSTPNQANQKETRKDQLTKQSYTEPKLPDSSKYWVIN
jgi:hypothetical protein